MGFFARAPFKEGGLKLQIGLSFEARNIVHLRYTRVEGDATTRRIPCSNPSPPNSEESALGATMGSRGWTDTVIPHSLLLFLSTSPAPGSTSATNSRKGIRTDGTLVILHDDNIK